MRNNLVIFLKNKPISMIMKIAVILTADTILRYLVIPRDFLRFDSQANYAAEMIWGAKILWLEKPLTFSRWLQIAWNQNIRSLIINLFIVGILIVLLFRFRFEKAENFQISCHTAVIAFSCLIFSAVGYSCMTYSAYLRGTLVWQYEITNILRVIFLVALFEELIYRGFITNEIFRLEQCGLKVPGAIIISAVIFGLLHVRSDVYNLVQGDYSIKIFDMAQTAFSPSITGISWAVILYYKKDVVSLICIHAAHNLLVHTYMSKSMLTIALYWIFYALLIIIYPAYLIVNARKKQRILPVTIV